MCNFRFTLFFFFTRTLSCARTVSSGDPNRTISLPSLFYIYRLPCYDFTAAGHRQRLPATSARSTDCRIARGKFPLHCLLSDRPRRNRLDRNPNPVGMYERRCCAVFWTRLTIDCVCSQQVSSTWLGVNKKCSHKPRRPKSRRKWRNSRGTVPTSRKKPRRRPWLMLAQFAK